MQFVRLMFLNTIVRCVLCDLPEPPEPMIVWICMDDVDNIMVKKRLRPGDQNIAGEILTHKIK